jgi:hypothetical protein
MRILLVAALVVPTSVAHADRVTTVNIGGMFGGVENAHTDESPEMKPAGGPRLTLGWENAPLALPATRGFTADLAFVPEVTAGAIMSDQRGEVMVGVGARAEVRMAQRDGGLLKVSARAAVYLAVRVLVIGDHKDTAFEGVLGEYLYLGKGRVRLGGEMGVIAREQTNAIYVHNREMGVFASAYLGWAM